MLNSLFSAASAAVAIYFLCFNFKAANGDDYLEHLTVFDPDRECEPGWYLGTRSCDLPTRLAWRVRLSQRLRGSKNSVYNKIPPECISECLKDRTCVAVSIDKYQDEVCYKYTTSYRLKLYEEQKGWTSMEMICCHLTKPRVLKRKPYYNQPIVFDASDCVSKKKWKGSKGKDHLCCPSEMAWIMYEKKMRKGKREKIADMERNNCLNRCMDNPYCTSVNQARDYHSGCEFNHIREAREDTETSVVYEKACCRLKRLSLWKNRTEDFPILYVLPKLCKEHEEYFEQTCDYKVWHAIDGAAMGEHFVEYHSASIKGCLNRCLEYSDCIGITIRPSLCRLHKAYGKAMTFGHLMYTVYRLTCCTVDV